MISLLIEHTIADQSDTGLCPKYGLEYIEEARIDDFYSLENETLMFCEEEYYAYLHEIRE